MASADRTRLAFFLTWTMEEDAPPSSLQLCGVPTTSQAMNVLTPGVGKSTLNTATVVLVLDSRQKRPLAFALFRLRRTQRTLRTGPL